jgi:ADP-ribosylglycohydrolase
MMLVECAIGDAYGFGFEYADVNLPLNTLERYLMHPTYGTLRPGQYTDDTQMSIAIAEALVERLPWNKYKLAQKFVEVFKRDPRDGYSKGFQQILESVDDGLGLIQRLNPISDKSGAAMRASPIGVLKDRREVIERAQIQAAITHDTPDGRWAAVASALMSHFFLHTNYPKHELGQWIRVWCVQAGDHTGIRWSEPWTGRVEAQGWMSVRAAITAIQAHDTLADILKACVAFSGDVDTVSAIALSAASCCPTIGKVLPRGLVDGLEAGPYGGQYLRKLDRDLMLFGSSQ